MRFVLTYSGLLPSSGNKPNPKAKHVIRKELHPQLKRQWEIEPSLQAILNGQPDADVTASTIWKKFGIGKFNFLPLVSKKFNLVCQLQVTMLRREGPGSIIRHGGDIDGRIKTLLDSLAVPQLSAVENIVPECHEKPFYCLLEDDSLVTDLEMKTERLLEPATPGKEKDVRLLIRVTVRPTTVTNDNLRFLGGFAQ